MQRSPNVPDIEPEADGNVYVSTLAKAYLRLKAMYQALQISDNEKIDWINQRIKEQQKRFGVKH